MDYLLDPPIWALLLIAGAGVVMAISGNRRQDRTLLRVGGAVVLLTVAWGIIGAVKETDIEQVERRTTELVRAAEQRDWGALASVLHPNVTFYQYRNRDALVAGAEKTIDRIGLQSAGVTRMETKQDPTGIVVNLNATSVQSFTLNRPFPTAWRLHWLDDGDRGWLLYRIEALPTLHIGPDQIHANLERTP